MSSAPPPVTTALHPLIGTDLSRSFGDHTVLDGVGLTVSPGQRVGLVGENGAGKSTLLRLLAGEEAPDSGTVRRPDDLAYLPQEPSFGGRDLVRDALEHALAPLHRAVEQVERLGAAMSEPGAGDAVADRFATALAWAQDHEAWDADRRATVAAERLGVAHLARDRPVSTLSGGQRTRLAMAALITRRPACVLLDEPTNHLDDAAMELLESFLRTLPGVVVAASHDRVFLETVCTDIVDLDPGTRSYDGGAPGALTRFGGGFGAYLDVKAAARRRWEETYAGQQERIAELRAATRIGTGQVAHNRGPTDNDKFIYKFKGANVERTLARRVRDAERRLDEAERDQVGKPPAPLRFDAPLTGRTDGSAIAVRARNLRVAGRVDVESLDVPTGGRLLVTGTNGSGKSSLLAVLDGRIRPDSGSLSVSAGRVGTLEQDVSFEEPGRSARQLYADRLGVQLAESRPLSGLGLLHPRELSKPVGVLSVGQRRRLALALLVARAPDLLLLDEPTNHISLTLASELEQALDTSPGTVVVASHDRWLRRHWEGPALELRRPGRSAGLTARG